MTVFFPIYSIHLIHLGSRKSDLSKNHQTEIVNKLQRADITDRNGNYLAKTVSSIDIGIKPTEIIDQKKLLLNLRYIFPDKNYDLIKIKLKILIKLPNAISEVLTVEIWSSGMHI